MANFEVVTGFADNNSKTAKTGFNNTLLETVTIAAKTAKDAWLKSLTKHNTLHFGVLGYTRREIGDLPSVFYKTGSEEPEPTIKENERLNFWGQKFVYSCY